MVDASKNKSMVKILIAVAAALVTFLIGKKVVKEVRNKKTREEY
jgi:hypothetical protein